MKKNIAQVAVGLPVDGPFDYSVPEEYKGSIKIGQRVSVLLRNRPTVGFVVGFLEKSRYRNLKSVIALLDNIPALDNDALEFTKMFAQYYGCSWGEAIETALPNLLRQKRVLELSTEVGMAQASEQKKELILCHDQGGIKGWPYVLEKIRAVLSRKQGVIVLVPEKLFVHKVKTILEAELDVSVASLDKQLTPKKELEEWVCVKEGQKQVVIGTRSAVFAPVANLGLIVIHDEENMSYKQEHSPSYHVRDVAEMRLNIGGGILLYVSSAPSAEVWWKVKKEGGLVQTFEPERTADMQFIDMTNYKPYKKSTVSYPLQNNIEGVLAKGGKVLLFLNRRGFSKMTRCNQCGHVLKCQRCDVTLSYLYSKKKLVCHLCSTAVDLPRICPGCGGSYLRSMGIGVEKIEDDLRKMFPHARIGRFDKDTKDFPKSADIIVATQAVLKVLDASAVDFIGVLDFDAELNRFDFRSAQKAFSLLINLRKAAKEKMFVQTYQRENYCLKAALKMDFEKFYKQEIKLRKELGFPPFKHLVALCLRGKEEHVVFDQAKDFFDKIQSKGAKTVEILDPQPDALPKLRDQFRFTIMLRGKSLTQILKCIKDVMKAFKRKQGVIITINVDP